MKVFFNLFCKDIDSQMTFYKELLNLPELEQKRSPIYRALDAGSSELGFNAQDAYALLGLTDRQPSSATLSPPLVGYATFMLESAQDVDMATQKAVTLMGSVLKAPYKTYYNEWQAVLCDPEENVFRISAPVS